MNRYEPQTVFVLERLKETSWEDRSYIGDLMYIERVLLAGGPRGWAGNMSFHRFRETYPVEITFIRREIRDEVYTSPIEFRRARKEHERALQADEEKWQRHNRERQLEEQRLDTERRRKWLEHGGRK